MDSRFKLRWQILIVAACVELLLIAATSGMPHGEATHALEVPIFVFLAPGLMLSFLVGGGMSMVDGLTPAWRDNISALLGFVINLPLTYGAVLFVSKLYSAFRPHFRFEHLRNK